YVRDREAPVDEARFRRGHRARRRLAAAGTVSRRFVASPARGAGPVHLRSFAAPVRVSKCVPCADQATCRRAGDSVTFENSQAWIVWATTVGAVVLVALLWIKRLPHLSKDF